ncbi:MAG TPA: hypothetical protein VK447_11620 [Myxococcaceae bacterium]|nr:hypothetical protein [Myxococcaceae bacterium]
MSKPPYSDQSPYEQAQELAARGLSAEEIKRKLMGRGLDADSAGVLAGTVGAQTTELDIGAMTSTSRSRSSAARWNPENFIVGVVMCMTGVFFSMVSCSAQSSTDNGGKAWIEYAALIGAAACFVTGLARRG